VKLRLRIAAILLSFLFSLKMGNGLLLHNLFHNNIEITEHPRQAENELTYACNCIDDFLSPVAENPVVSVLAPLFLFALQKDSSQQDLCLPFFETSSSRGPPVFIA